MRDLGVKKKATKKDLNIVVVEKKLTKKGLDVVVGIPSYNEADSIGWVTRQVGDGLKKYYSHLSTAIVNADNSSEDGTKEVFLQADTGEIPKVYLPTAPGVKGKGTNLRNLFNYLLPYQPRVVVVVDADLRSIEPEWIGRFGQTVLKGYDFVVPLYSRNEYDGTITNHICYPLFYGLLGRNLRQPIAGDFAFSGLLMEYWMKQNWGPNVLQYGVDIFMTLQAVCSGLSIAQVNLGSKVHKPSVPKLGDMFTQVVETFFAQLTEARNLWSPPGKPVTPPTFHDTTRPSELPQELSIDYKSLKQQSLAHFQAHHALILTILPKELGEDVEAMFARQILRLPASLWALVVYSFLAAYAAASRDKERGEIVEALKPLYFARVVSYIRETLELDYTKSEKRLAYQAETFWKHGHSLDGVSATA